MFPVTPTGNGSVGRGTRALSESSFKVGENLLAEQSVAGESSKNEKNSFFKND
jgi:hypothetical protein